MPSPRAQVPLPARSDFYGAPPGEWENACFDAEMAGPPEASSTNTTTDEAVVSPPPPVLETEITSPPVPAVLIFDTETTGLTRQDQVIQLGYVGFDADEKEVVRYERVLRSGRKSCPEALRVHGIDTEDPSVQATAADPMAEIQRFVHLARAVRAAGGVVAAHNAAFDVRLLAQTARTFGTAPPLTSADVFCTMRALDRLPRSTYGGAKSNEKLCRFLGGNPDDFGQLHTAAADCLATAFVFHEGRRRGWWKTNAVA